MINQLTYNIIISVVSGNVFSQSPNHNHGQYTWGTKIHKHIHTLCIDLLPYIFLSCFLIKEQNLNKNLKSFPLFLEQIRLWHNYTKLDLFTTLTEKPNKLRKNNYVYLNWFTQVPVCIPNSLQVNKYTCMTSYLTGKSRPPQSWWWRTSESVHHSWSGRCPIGTPSGCHSFPIWHHRCTVSHFHL